MARRDEEREEATTVGASAAVVNPADAAVEQWFIDTFHNRGLQGQEYNRLRDAVDDLKRRLAETK